MRKNYRGSEVRLFYYEYLTHNKISAKFPHISGCIPPTPAEDSQLRLWMDDLYQNGIKPHAHIRLFLQEFLEHIQLEEFNLLVEQFACKFYYDYCQNQI
jgi:hypothetical protein